LPIFPNLGLDFPPIRGLDSFKHVFHRSTVIVLHVLPPDMEFSKSKALHPQPTITPPN
jgi:hypothetical protein